MAKLSLDDLRAKFKQSQNRNSNYYNFWLMDFDKSCKIRFLPDANEECEWGFFVDKVFHNLTINGEDKSVPCIAEFGEECPICKLSQEYYRKDDKENGLKYWKKHQYLAQALIIEDPMAKSEEDSAVGKVKLISLSYTLHKIIKSAVEDQELDEMPYFYKGGTDFIIKKTKQDGKANYTLSNFSRKSTDLDDEIVEYVEEKLIDLSTLLPKNPGLERVEDMLNAHLTGSSASSNGSGDKENKEEDKTAAKLKEAAASLQDDSSSDNDKDESSESPQKIDAKAILAKIKNRG